jgi:hypothetical protein
VHLKKIDADQKSILLVVMPNTLIPPTEPPSTHKVAGLSIKSQFDTDKNDI